MNSLDPTTVLIAIFSTIMAPQIAEIVGPYTIIVIASTTGAAWSLGDKPTLTKLQSLRFFIKINMVAILITVFISYLIGNYINMADRQWLLAPVALLIGLLGNEWGKINGWLLAKVKSYVHQDKGANK